MGRRKKFSQKLSLLRLNSRASSPLKTSGTLSFTHIRGGREVSHARSRSAVEPWKARALFPERHASHVSRREVNPAVQTYGSGSPSRAVSVSVPRKKGNIPPGRTDVTAGATLAAWVSPRGSRGRRVTRFPARVSRCGSSCEHQHGRGPFDRVCYPRRRPRGRCGHHGNRGGHQLRSSRRRDGRVVHRVRVLRGRRPELGGPRARSCRERCLLRGPV